jgi:hypothetical protein
MLQEQVSSFEMCLTHCTKDRYTLTFCLIQRVIVCDAAHSTVPTYMGRRRNTSDIDHLSYYGNHVSVRTH